MALTNAPPTFMRAAQWRSVAGGIEKNLLLNNKAEVPKLAIKLPKDSVLVRVAYASLNHLDYKVAEMPLGSILFSKPATPGLDFSGTVVTSTLDQLKPGQHVLGRTEPLSAGTLAEYVVVGKRGIAALPDGVSFKDAACVGTCGITAIQCMVPFLKQGDKVLINGGSGGVGIFAIQTAKALGCARITVVCSGRNADLCRTLGADHVVDYTTDDPVTALKRDGQQYDHILDTIFGNANLYWHCHHYLKPDGKYISVGLPLRLRTMKDLLAIYLVPRILGGGQRPFKFHSVTGNPDHFALAARWIKEGRVKPVIEGEFELGDAPVAYERLKSGRVRGKLVVRV